MTATKNLGGTFTFSGSSTTVHRLGYGAMQLAGPNVFGPPKNMEAALGVLRAAVEAGVDHIDTSDVYGPHITNQIIKTALHPYPQNLTIATKVGARRGEDGSWIPDFSPASIRSSVEDNLRNLKLESLHLVNLRVGGLIAPAAGSIAEPLSALESMQREGLVQDIGLSNVSPQQYEEARKIANIVCVQNHYNVAHREDDAFIDQLEAAGVAYVPFFPLGGFSPLQSSVLDSAATSLKRTTLAVALAWILQRASNILLIPGTSSAEHLRENIEAASLVVPENTVAELNAIGKTTN
jgi:pyridoxine 4-dehydrogenase